MPNLTVLNDRHLTILVGTRRKLMLSVSLDAASERSYRCIRRADFSEVTRNIDDCSLREVIAITRL